MPKINFPWVISHGNAEKLDSRCLLLHIFPILKKLKQHLCRVNSDDGSGQCWYTLEPSQASNTHEADCGNEPRPLAPFSQIQLTNRLIFALHEMTVCNSHFTFNRPTVGVRPCVMPAHYVFHNAAVTDPWDSRAKAVLSTIAQRVVWI